MSDKPLPRRASDYKPGVIVNTRLGRAVVIQGDLVGLLRFNEDALDQLPVEIMDMRLSLLAEGRIEPVEASQTLRSWHDLIDPITKALADLTGNEVKPLADHELGKA